MASEHHLLTLACLSFERSESGHVFLYITNVHTWQTTLKKVRVAPPEMPPRLSIGNSPAGNFYYMSLIFTQNCKVKFPVGGKGVTAVGDDTAEIVPVKPFV